MPLDPVIAVEEKPIAVRAENGRHSAQPLSLATDPGTSARLTAAPSAWEAEVIPIVGDLLAWGPCQPQGSHRVGCRERGRNRAGGGSKHMCTLSRARGIVDLLRGVTVFHGQPPAPAASSILPSETSESIDFRRAAANGTDPRLRISNAALATTAEHGLSCPSNPAFRRSIMTTGTLDIVRRQLAAQEHGPGRCRATRWASPLHGCRRQASQVSRPAGAYGRDCGRLITAAVRRRPGSARRAPVRRPASAAAAGSCRSSRRARSPPPSPG